MRLEKERFVNEIQKPKKNQKTSNPNKLNAISAV